MTAPEGAPCPYAVAWTAAALTIVGMAIDSAFWQSTLHRFLWGHTACIVLSAGIIAVLVATRRRPIPWLASVALLVNTTAALAALRITDNLLASSGEPWTPFEAQRLATLAMAVLAPPRVWLGVALIAEITAVSFAEWTSWGPAIRATLPAATPWLVVAYALFASVVYAHQLARQSLERRAARAHAEAAVMERHALLVFAVRDLANTPLQTIELTVALIRRRHGLDPRLLERLERAAGRLVAIGRLLEEQQQAATRRTGGLAS